MWVLIWSAVLFGLSHSNYQFIWNINLPSYIGQNRIGDLNLVTRFVICALMVGPFLGPYDSDSKLAESGIRPPSNYGKRGCLSRFLDCVVSENYGTWEVGKSCGR